MHFGHVLERRSRRARQRSSGRPGLRACRRGGAGSLPRLRHGRSCSIHEPYRTASGSELGEIEPSLDAPASLLAVRFIVSKTGQRRQWSRFEKMGTVHAVTIAEHHRSEEHTSELQSLMRISYAVFCLKKKKRIQ